jgi:hypothetical protein
VIGLWQEELSLKTKRKIESRRGKELGCNAIQRSESTQRVVATQRVINCMVDQSFLLGECDGKKEFQHTHIYIIVAFRMLILKIWTQEFLQ